MGTTEDLKDTLAAEEEAAREVAYLVRHNMQAQFVVRDAEATFMGLILSERVEQVALEPQEPYLRMLLHRLADLFELEHGSDGIGEGRHLVVTKSLHSQIPSTLVSDILFPPEAGEQAVPTPVFQVLQRDSSSGGRFSDYYPRVPPSQLLSLEDRKAAYETARARIFSAKDDSPRGLANLDLDTSGGTPPRPRAVPVVARRMIAHALNMPALRLLPAGSQIRPLDGTLAADLAAEPSAQQSRRSDDRGRDDLAAAAVAGSDSDSTMPGAERREAGHGCGAQVAPAHRPSREDPLPGAARAARRMFATALGLTPVPEGAAPLVPGGSGTRASRGEELRRGGHAIGGGEALEGMGDERTALGGPCVDGEAEVGNVSEASAGLPHGTAASDVSHNETKERGVLGEGHPQSCGSGTVEEASRRASQRREGQKNAERQRGGAEDPAPRAARAARRMFATALGFTPGPPSRRRGIDQLSSAEGSKEGLPDVPPGEHSSEVPMGRPAGGQGSDDYSHGLLSAVVDRSGDPAGGPADTPQVERLPASPAGGGRAGGPLGLAVDSHRVCLEEERDPHAPSASVGGQCGGLADGLSGVSPWREGAYGQAVAAGHKAPGLDEVPDAQRPEPADAAMAHCGEGLVRGSGSGANRALEGSPGAADGSMGLEARGATSVDQGKLASGGLLDELHGDGGAGDKADETALKHSVQRLRRGVQASSSGKPFVKKATAGSKRGARKGGETTRAPADQDLGEGNLAGGASKRATGSNPSLPTGGLEEVKEVGRPHGRPSLAIGQTRAMLAKALGPGVLMGAGAEKQRLGRAAFHREVEKVTIDRAFRREKVDGDDRQLVYMSGDNTRRSGKRIGKGSLAGSQIVARAGKMLVPDLEQYDDETGETFFLIKN